MSLDESKKTECLNTRLQRENAALRGILAQMGFNADALLSGPDSDHCRNVLLHHTGLDEKALMDYVKGDEDVMRKWRESWASLRTR